MQAAPRNREPDPRSFVARRGHLPKLSISDDGRHVTEAIGYMYGDDGSPTSPLTDRTSYRSDKTSSGEYEPAPRRISMNRKPLPERKMSYGDGPDRLSQQHSQSSRQGLVFEQINEQAGNGSSPTRPRAPSDTARTQFPLNDIDYESSPAAVAQELSNLQALRRMSMDVGATGDPDLPQLNTAAIPNAPLPSSSEDDSARLFWVPARLHPELAPKEFKSFLDSKAEQIKRRSGELSAFDSSNSSRLSSLSSDDGFDSLRRKKSMLSHEIDNSIGYQDGADRLERKRSSGPHGALSDPNLQEIESAMPRTSLEPRIDEETGDIILPSVPGSSLKRSTRTKYQRAEGRKARDEGGTYAQRMARRQAAGGRESPTMPYENDPPPMPSFSSDVPNFALTLKDPNTTSTGRTGPKINFSRPGERQSSPPAPDEGLSIDTKFDFGDDAGSRSSTQSMPEAQSRRIQSPASVNLPDKSIPQIIESPPPEDRPVRTSSMRPPPTAVYTIPSSQSVPQEEEEEEAQQRKQQETPVDTAQRPSIPAKQSTVTLSSGRRSPNRNEVTITQPKPLLGLDPALQPSRNDISPTQPSYTPTLTTDKRVEARKKEEKKSGWSWLLGEKERDKDKDKDQERLKMKISKPNQNHDNTRLDVLQTSIDGVGKGRESLVLDRESLRIDEDRKKESIRKTSSSSEKKEKESIFSSLFGGKRHKAEKEAQRKLHDRLSPEPRAREMRPDIDYNWTRFSILEERAIYRMAHIKLANPRRALYSQVLLSNFMYSYLAKVQQMHPQMNLPTSAKQQRKQKEQEKQHSQPEEFAQYQRYQQQQSQQEVATQQHMHPQQGYDRDPSAMYDYEYATNGSATQKTQHQSSQRPQSRGNKQFLDSNDSDYAGYNDDGGDESYAMSGGGNMYYHQQTTQQQPQSPGRPQNRQHSQHDPRYGNRHDEDDANDMW